MKRIDFEEVRNVLEVMIRGMPMVDVRDLANEVFQYLSVAEPAEDVCLSGFYKNIRGGPSIQAFEAALEEYTGVPYARTCTNGTSALHLALMAAGIGRGMKVAIPPLTFSATATAVLMVGAEPVFVDVEQESYNMDPAKLREVVERESIRAVIPVHLLGVPVKMNYVRHLADEYDLIIIEDNAQGLGAKYRAAKTGNWGILATQSFQETKSGSSLGEGGAVLTSNPEYAESIMYLRNHGQQYGDYSKTCWNYRLTEAQAAMGIAQLAKLDGFNEIQRTNRDILREVLEPYGFVFQKAPPDSYATFYLIGTIHEDAEYRSRVVDALHEDGWGKPKPGSTISLGYTKTIMDLPLLLQYKRHCPVSEWLVGRSVWWDCMRWRSEEEAKEIAQRIEKTVKGVS